MAFDILLTALCQLSVGLLAWIAIEWEHELCFSMNCEFLVRREEINDKFLRWKLSCNCSARAAVWSYVIASYIGSNRIFKIFNSKWSYDKMLIDWERSGRTENIWLSVRTYGPSAARSSSQDLEPDLESGRMRSVRTLCLEPSIFPSGPPTQSISTYYVQWPWRGRFSEGLKMLGFLFWSLRLVLPMWNSLQSQQFAV